MSLATSAAVRAALRGTMWSISHSDESVKGSPQIAHLKTVARRHTFLHERCHPLANVGCHQWLTEHEVDFCDFGRHGIMAVHDVLWCHRLFNSALYRVRPLNLNDIARAI